MNRRGYLGACAGAGALCAAGCLGALGSDGTVLGPPDHPQGDPSHPIHGEDFPAFELHDVVTDTTVRSASLLEDGRAILLTFFYTACPDSTCPMLLEQLRTIQQDATEHGYADDIALVAVTFDPDTDTEPVLLEEAQAAGLDLDAGNLHILRPETNEDAEDVVAGDFGVPYRLGHDHHEDDHDGHDHEEGGDIHYVILFLANADGVVERAYHDPPGFSTSAIRSDVRTVVDA